MLTIDGWPRQGTESFRVLATLFDFKWHTRHDSAVPTFGQRVTDLKKQYPIRSRWSRRHPGFKEHRLTPGVMQADLFTLAEEV